MRTIHIFLLLSALTLLYCGNASNSAKPDNDKILVQDTSECSDLYLFNDQYIKLETVEMIVTDGIPSEDFKTCSKYAHRFMQAFTYSAELNGRSYALDVNDDTGKYALNISEDGKLLKTVKLQLEDPLPEVRDYTITLYTFGEDIITLARDMYTTHYIISKYDPDGELLKQTKVEHTFVTHPEPNTDYHHPYLYFSKIIGSQMIFSSSDYTEKQKTVILSLDDLSTKEYEEAAVGLIPDENEETLAGFISKDENKYKVHLFDGRSFEFDIEYGGSACECLVYGNKLYIAHYEPLSCGSGLQCFDINTGKKLWTADVKQIIVAHSKYFNEVYVSRYKNKIILEGQESFGNYVQIFNAETGKAEGIFGEFPE